jgi:hypothetical protein
VNSGLDLGQQTIKFLEPQLRGQPSRTPSLAGVAALGVEALSDHDRLAA